MEICSPELCFLKLSIAKFVCFWHSLIWSTSFLSHLHSDSKLSWKNLEKNIEFSLFRSIVLIDGHRSSSSLKHFFRDLHEHQECERLNSVRWKRNESIAVEMIKIQLKFFLVFFFIQTKTISTRQIVVARLSPAFFFFLNFILQRRMIFVGWRHAPMPIARRTFQWHVGKKGGTCRVLSTFG